MAKAREELHQQAESAQTHGQNGGGEASVHQFEPKTEPKAGKSFFEKAARSIGARVVATAIIAGGGYAATKAMGGPPESEPAVVGAPVGSDVPQPPTNAGTQNTLPPIEAPIPINRPNVPDLEPQNNQAPIQLLENIFGNLQKALWNGDERYLYYVYQDPNNPAFIESAERIKRMNQGLESNDGRGIDVDTATAVRVDPGSYMVIEYEYAYGGVLQPWAEAGLIMENGRWYIDYDINAAPNGEPEQ